MKIQYITVHCSASSNPNLTAKDIKQMHLNRGWSDIGYHFVIRTDGSIEQGRPLSKMGAGVAGHNKNNLHICLIGGLNEKGEAVDNFTWVQKHALFALILEQAEQNNVEHENIKGHRDWSPDLNKDGVIQKNEWIKMCPCFDVKQWFKQTKIEYGMT